MQNIIQGGHLYEKEKAVGVGYCGYIGIFIGFYGVFKPRRGFGSNCCEKGRYKGICGGYRDCQV
jgi:hypothetical protein